MFESVVQRYVRPLPIGLGEAVVDEVKASHLPGRLGVGEVEVTALVGIDAW